MKNIKSLLLFYVAIVTSSMVNAQEKKEDETKRIVEAQNYVFVAQRVSPLGRPSRDLTPDYDLTITKDTLISDLPYFGRAYSAPIDPTEGGIKFTSTKFEYANSKKNKGWRITIRPKDASGVQELYLEIFDNGNANLQVTSTNRQSISFNGYIREGQTREKKAF